MSEGLPEPTADSLGYSSHDPWWLWIGDARRLFAVAAALAAVYTLAVYAVPTSEKVGHTSHVASVGVAAGYGLSAILLGSASGRRSTLLRTTLALGALGLIATVSYERWMAIREELSWNHLDTTTFWATCSSLFERLSDGNQYGGWLELPELMVQWPHRLLFPVILLVGAAGGMRRGGRQVAPPAAGAISYASAEESERLIPFGVVLLLYGVGSIVGGYWVGGHGHGYGTDGKPVGFMPGHYAVSGLLLSGLAATGAGLALVWRRLALPVTCAAGAMILAMTWFQFSGDINDMLYPFPYQAQPVLWLQEESIDLVWRLLPGLATLLLVRRMLRDKPGWGWYRLAWGAGTVALLALLPSVFGAVDDLMLEKVYEMQLGPDHNYLPFGRCCGLLAGMLGLWGILRMARGQAWGVALVLLGCVMAIGPDCYWAALALQSGEDLLIASVGVLALDVPPCLLATGVAVLLARVVRGMGRRRS